MKLGFRYWRQVVFVFVLLPCTSLANGQPSSSSVELFRNIISQIKSTPRVSYKYQLNAIFPDGKKEELQGEAYIDNPKKILFNDSKAMTILYDGKWYLNANHRKKTITIIELDKKYKPDQQKELEQSLFEGDYLNMWMDSFVVKYGIVQEINQTDGKVTAHVVFPSSLPIKKMDFVFDVNRKLLVSLSMTLFTPYDQSGKKGTTRLITCSNYSTTPDAAKINTDQYFQATGTKIILKKYSTYSLSKIP